MARKANISREEIHKACWLLLEQNYFPNIPRIADYFAKLDGRKCSNTTLLNGISEWEESYKEQQRNSFSRLDVSIAPVIKQLERELVVVLQSLVEEKIADIQHAERLKSDASVGQYLSLSDSLAQQTHILEIADEQNATMKVQLATVQAEAAHFQQRHDDILSTVKVSQLKISELESQLYESQLNLAQKEVDLAKLDNIADTLMQENHRLSARVKQLEAQLITKEESAALAAITALTAKVEALAENANSSAEPAHKNRDKQR